ncbi:MAG: GNAT family N-acetyltransferase [Bacteroidota bacterium]
MKDEHLQFSFASSTDITSINVLVNSAYRGDSSKRGWTTEADLLDGIRTDEEGLKSMLAKPSSVIIQVREEKELVGCVYLEKQEAKMYLGMLTVAPNLQARGIGKALLQKAEEYALQQKCTSIIMTVITRRSELIAWYERHGYSDTGERKPFPADPGFGLQKIPLEFLVLEKPLR